LFSEVRLQYPLKRSLSLASLALLAALMLSTFVGLGWETSSRSTEAASGVKVTVGCRSNPETARVENNTNHRIKIKSVGSVYKPRSNEPFRIGDGLGPGRSVVFESGDDANHDVLTGQYIYNNDAGSKEGVTVSTSAGRFSDRCG
jgi:hypothetical protein